MVLKELKKMANLGLKAANMDLKEVEKHLSPFVKAGKMTGLEAKSLAKDLMAVGKTHHDRVHRAVKKQVEKELKNHGYVKVKVAPKKAATKKPKAKVVKNIIAKKKLVKK